MARLRRNRVTVPARERVEFDLMLGPTAPQNGVDEFSVEELEAAWEAYGAEIMRDWRTDKPGFRPAAYWLFELGEAPPEGREEAVLRLAELGLLHDGEVEVLAARRTWTSINDGTTHTDPDAVRLYERVLEVRP